MNVSMFVRIRNRVYVCEYDLNICHWATLSYTFSKF